MNDVALDLAGLDALDLHALRLGAQVMRHRAELAAGPRVAAFFAALGSGIDDELARRVRSLHGRSRSIRLTFEPSNRPDARFEEHGLLTEYLDLLSSNPRLSIGVRMTFASMGGQLPGASNTHS